MLGWRRSFGSAVRKPASTAPDLRRFAQVSALELHKPQHVSRVLRAVELYLRSVGIALSEMVTPYFGVAMS